MNPRDPAPMEGHGAYNRHSKVQASGASPALPLLADTAGHVVLPPDAETIVIADYGSSEGRNSLLPMASAIEVLRARVAPARALSVVHTDLPSNDFAALFQLLDTDPASYLRNDPAVFSSAIGRSFYRQILPFKSVTLGWSAWAVQWLSRIPALIPDHVQVACSQDKVARNAYVRQAAEDWEVFLRCRARELRSGGRLVVVAMASTDEGDFGYRPVLSALHGSLEELVADGLVRAEEALRMAIPTVGRTRAEFAAPFASGSFEGLTLESLNIFQNDDAIWRDFSQDGDAARYGERWAAFSRTSVMPTLALSLAGGRGDSRGEEFSARLETSMAKRLASAPEPNTIPLATLVIAAN